MAHVLAEKEVLADLVNRIAPKVNDVIGFTDGVSLPISDPISQATNYNGYHHDTMINNVFLASLRQVKLYFLALIFQDRGMILKSSFP